MKKLIFGILLITMPMILIGCRDNEPTSHTVMVNVSYHFSGSENMRIASPTIVRLYRERASEFDFEQSVSSMWHRQQMTLRDGSTAIPAYVSGSLSGINTFNSVDNGNYTVIVFFRPTGFTWSFAFYFGYREINVSYRNRVENFSHRIVFEWGTDAGRFIRK